MKILVFLALVGIANCLSLSFDTELDGQWKDFKKSFGKIYSGKEETLRRLAWEENVATIVNHNIRADLGFHTYHMGLNEYSDLTLAEFKRTMNGYRVSNKSESDGSTWVPPSNVQIPDQVDWREEGYVTPVKNQGACGSCWAFSTTGSLEGQHKRKTGLLISLSEQNLVDCAKGNEGCAGGWMDTAFQYIRDNKGIDTEFSYPYTGKDGTCRFSKKGVGATVTGFADIPAADEEALKQAVATVGPVSVAIDSTQAGFINYKDGVYVDPECATDVFTHAILVVGYGTQDGADYWLVKNSWGESWGQKGYIMMARNKNNQCGIASKASYPLV